MRWGQVDGVTYMTPSALGDAYGVYYNKDIFDQVGITEEPKTWMELLAVCQKLKDAGIQPIMDNCQDAAVNFTAPLYGSEVKAGNANICAGYL